MNNLKAILKEKGMTQNELAHKTGLTVVTISKMVRNIRSSRVDSVMRVADVLQCPPSRLLDGEWKGKEATPAPFRAMIMDGDVMVACKDRESFMNYAMNLTSLRD